MKKFLLITSMILTSSIALLGQNFIGLNQSTIIRRFGEPDEKGANFFVYADNQEEGKNIYYFDENKQCEAFILIRKDTYYKDYEKLLSKNFTQMCETFYVSKSKSLNFQAEVTHTPDEFQIRIQHLQVGQRLSCTN